MFKFTPTTGGHPISLNDLTHLQNAIIENSTAFGLSGSNGASFGIISGVESDNVFSQTFVRNFTDGYVYYNGEIFKVDAVSDNSVQSTWDFYIVESYGVNNPVTYENASSVNVHTIRKLEAKDPVVEGVAGEFSVSDLLLTKTKWIDLQLNDTNGSLVTNNKAQIKKIGDQIYLRGQVLLSGLSVAQYDRYLSSNFFTIPDDCRPIADVRRYIPIANSSGTIQPTQFQIDGVSIGTQGGGLTIYNPDTTTLTTLVIDLNGANYLISNPS